MEAAERRRWIARFQPFLRMMVFGTPASSEITGSAPTLLHWPLNQTVLAAGRAGVCQLVARAFLPEDEGDPAAFALYATRNNARAVVHLHSTHAFAVLKSGPMSGH
jgi:hypothetical protein